MVRSRNFEVIKYGGTSYRVCKTDVFLRKIKLLLKKTPNIASINTEDIFYNGFYFIRSWVCDIENKIFFSVSGKGLSLNEAKASLFGEMLERWFALPRYNDKRVICEKYSDIKRKAIDPRLFVLPERKIFNYSPYKKIGWIKGYSYKRKKYVYIPVDFVYWTQDPNIANNFYKKLNISSLCYLTPNGLAAGSTMEEAFLPALFEVIERDAVVIAERLRLNKPDIGRSCLDKELNKILLAIEKERSLTIFIKNLTTDIPIPVVGVYFLDKNKKLVSFGSGAHIDPQIALKRAVTECLQLYLSGIYRIQKIPFYTTEHLFQRVQLLKKFLKEITVPKSIKVLSLFLSEIVLANDFVEDIIYVELYKDDNFNVVKVLVVGLQPLDFRVGLRISRRFNSLMKKNRRDIKPIYKHDIIGCPYYRNSKSY